MRRRTLAIAVSLPLLACGVGKPKVTRETVLPLLQQEAQTLKAEGEKMPDLGVKATWNVAAVEVREQAGTESQPFAGTIRFRIETRTNDFDGPKTQSFEKKFNYVFDTKSNKWLFKP